MATRLDDVKKALRISHDYLDSDIASDIDACLADLAVCGIIDPSEDDELIFNAVKLYCRASFTDDTTKGAEFLRRYEALKACLSMAEGYGWRADE